MFGCGTFTDFKVIVSSLQRTLFPTRTFLFHPNSDYLIYFIMSISIKYVYVVQKNSSRYCLPIIIMMKLCEWTGIINKSIDIHPLCLKIRKQNPLFLNTVYNIRDIIPVSVFLLQRVHIFGWSIIASLKFSFGNVECV